MRRQFNNIISVVFTFIKLSIMKLFHGKNLKFYYIERFSPNVKIHLNYGKLFLGEKISCHSNSMIGVNNGGIIKIKDKVKINYNCIIACHESIEIDEGTEIGPNVCIYDHDHDYRQGLKNCFFKTSPVKIGKNCWIGANSIVLKGSNIGDNTVIAAGTVVRGLVPSDSVVYNKKELIIKKY